MGEWEMQTEEMLEWRKNGGRMAEEWRKSDTPADGDGPESL